MNKKQDIITDNDFRHMIAGAYSLFKDEYEKINSLNVFPVPDGDTGTNMLRTLGAVAQSVSESADTGIGMLARRAADSAIMGARGNSGVILSQIFRGLGRGLAGKQEVTSGELGKAFQYGVLYAYRSVAKPVEGTILTVAKGIAKGARKAVRSALPIEDILETAIEAGRSELERTPELLPTLKAAGVVDAGGMGLLVFLRGCLKGLGGEFSAPPVDLEMSYRASKGMPTAPETFDIAHPYCTEFIVRNTKVSEVQARQALEQLGDSLITAKASTALKVHIHTGHPGMVLEQAVSWGTLHDIKIDNMSDQHRSVVIAAQTVPQQPLGVITIAAGDGISGIMTGLGADVVVAGGQSMNPSVEEMVDAVHTDKAERFIILPNNKNIVLAAQQVKKLLGERVEIVETMSAQQGIAALTVYDKERSMEDNLAAMRQAAAALEEGAVTVAVRDTVLNDEPVHEGSYIGIIHGKLRMSGAELVDILLATIRSLVQDDSEIITLYYGADIPTYSAKIIRQVVQETWPQLGVELHDGGQPTYHFLVSVE